MKHPDFLTAKNNLGVALEKQQKYRDAEGIFRDCLRSGREVRGPGHPETATTVYNLGHVLFQEGRLEDAEPLLRESVATRRQALGGEHPSTLYAISGLASLLVAPTGSMKPRPSSGLASRRAAHPRA